MNGFYSQTTGISVIVLVICVVIGAFCVYPNLVHYTRLSSPEPSVIDGLLGGEPAFFPGDQYPTVVVYNGLAVDVQKGRIGANEFIHGIYGGKPPFLYQLTDTPWEDTGWQLAKELTCDNVEVRMYRVRVVDSYGNSSPPVETYLIVEDSNGICEQGGI
jgi:hypothetical protein